MTVSGPPSTLRRMPARPGKCTGSSSTKAWVEPESNQTSRMSSTFCHSSLAREPRKRSRAPAAYQASAPSCSKASAMRALTRSSCRISAVPSPFSRTNTVIGTPQARWREITQSGLLVIMPVMRFSPCGGTQRVTLMAASARARSVSPGCAAPSGPAIGLSMAMNHCGVLRKITGFFERHECGYWCLSRPRAISMPASIRALMHGLVGVALLALVGEDALAGEAGRLLGEAAVVIDRVGDRGIDAARLEHRAHSRSRPRSPRGRVPAPYARSRCRCRR